MLNSFAFLTLVFNFYFSVFNLNNMTGQSLFKTDHKVVIYADGGARGNPGPAACGFVVLGIGYGEYLGETTNNIAEYQGIIHALKKLKALVGSKKAEETEVEARLDSELLVRQFNNEYKINDEDLKP